MNEKFKPIKGYEGSYEVSNFGNVKSLAKVRYHRGKPQYFPEKLLKQEKTYKGYKRVMLADHGNNKKIYVHRLVADAFLPAPQEGQQINHKNLRKFDNRAANLEWLTAKQNTHHYLSKRPAIHM